MIARDIAVLGALALVACAPTEYGASEQAVATPAPGSGAGSGSASRDAGTEPGSDAGSGAGSDAGGGSGSDAGGGSGSDAGGGAGSDAGGGSGSDAGGGSGSDAGGGGGSDAMPPPDAGVGSGYDAMPPPDAPGDGSTCVHRSSTLASLLEGITIFDDTVPQSVIDALIVEVAALNAECPYTGLCREDLEALVALLTLLNNMPVSEELSPSRYEQVLTLQSAAWSAMHCMDDTLIGGGGPDPIDFTRSCTGGEWSRRMPYYASWPPLPNLMGCTVLAVTNRSGAWQHMGDVSSVSPGPFSSWERSMDDQGFGLWPASELLSQLGLSGSNVDFMQSPGSHQFATWLPIAPYRPTIAANGNAYIIYGRNNSTSTYLMTPRMFVDDGVLLDYEYGPARDSIKILGCPLEDFAEWEQLVFGNRQALDNPFVPFVPDRPGVWAILATCPGGPVPDPTTARR